jgi:hypothetical protein
MMNRISVMMTAVGLSVASLSAHAAANELRCIGDASPARLAITESLDRLSFSFSDPITRAAVTHGAPAKAAEGAGRGRLTVTRTVTITRSPKSAESFALSEPKGGMLRLNTHQLVIPVKYVGSDHIDINHIGSNNHIGSGATGGPSSKHNVPPVVPRGTTSLAKAPEIDPVSAVSGLTLLAGAIVVLRGRRRVLTPC